MDDILDIDWDTFLHEETELEYYIDEEDDLDEDFGSGDLIPDLC